MDTTVNLTRAARVRGLVQSNVWSCRRRRALVDAYRVFHAVLLRAELLAVAEALQFPSVVMR